MMRDQVKVRIMVLNLPYRSEIYPENERPKAEPLLRVSEENTKVESALTH